MCPSSTRSQSAAAAHRLTVSLFLDQHPLMAVAQDCGIDNHAIAIIALYSYGIQRLCAGVKSLNGVGDA
jgi:hypothetical protein